ncbi:hypothetical protein K7X08_031656 [Anisodus acutangulus]|uniref:Uncharacterized protein n=1 Tax=Anisodus acutangulus TaxID=402998 RepID=A0A9Q1MQH7_9SOLA|nr:hypothetical protein K7X08_031656 [Anisodus acutangulus]
MERKEVDGSSIPGDRTIDQSATTPSLQSKKHDQSAGKKSGEDVTSENDLQLGLGDATQLQSHINQHGMHGAAANSSVISFLKASGITLSNSSDRSKFIRIVRWGCIADGAGVPNSFGNAGIHALRSFGNTEIFIIGYKAVFVVKDFESAMTI